MYHVTLDKSLAPTVTLSNIICAFKSLTTKEINQVENLPERKIWQQSFYDYVIRNEKDYLRVWQYIDNNPARWAEDEYYICD